MRVGGCEQVLAESLPVQGVQGVCSKFHLDLAILKYLY